MQLLNCNFWSSLNDGQEEDFRLMKAEIYKANPCSWPLCFLNRLIKLNDVKLFCWFKLIKIGPWGIWDESSAPREVLSLVRNNLLNLKLSHWSVPILNFGRLPGKSQAPSLFFVDILLNLKLSHWSNTDLSCQAAPRTVIFSRLAEGQTKFPFRQVELITLY